MRGPFSRDGCSALTLHLLRRLIYVVLSLPVLFFCAWMLSSSSSDKSGSEIEVKTVPATMMNSDETRSAEVQAFSSSSYVNIRARRGYGI